LISQSNLALKMFPNTPKSAKSKLSNKLNEAKAGNGKQRLTDDDIKIGWKVLKDLAEDIMQKASTKE
jgi:hypothetical protein